MSNNQIEESYLYQRAHMEECWLGSVVAYRHLNGKIHIIEHSVYRWRFDTSATAARWLRDKLGWVSIPRFQNGGSMKNLYCRVTAPETEDEYIEVMQMSKGHYPAATDNYGFAESLDLDANVEKPTYSEREQYIYDNYADLLALYESY